MSEVQLLAECLSTQGEAESDGVKYIYMDDSTVYRFENNRMKKVSAAMLKRAAKLMSSQGSLPNAIAEQQEQELTTKKQKASKKTKPAPPQEDLSDDGPSQEHYRDDSEDDLEQVERKQRSRSKPSKAASRKQEAASNIDLNLYYENKAKMDYMSLEINRLNAKVNKLKQYKSIVNKITGGEYDPQPEPTVPVNQPEVQADVRQEPRRRANGSLFDDFL